jgi:hypothetical protein
MLERLLVEEIEVEAYVSHCQPRLQSAQRMHVGGADEHGTIKEHHDSAHQKESAYSSCQSSVALRAHWWLWVRTYPRSRRRPQSLSRVSTNSCKVGIRLEAICNVLWVSESHIVGILRGCMCLWMRSVRRCVG